MSKKVIFPLYGNQSVGNVMHHCKDLDLPFDVNYKLAQELMRRFKEVRFKVMFNERTGEIETVTMLED